MASAVLKELEELRSMLETPKKTYTPFTSLTDYVTPRHEGATAKTYSHALTSAEKSVDRLGRAIEAAEEEMEAALHRTTEVHKSHLRQKEVELQEMQRVLAAKERSIESLRDTLATTKRTYETRLSQAESALAMKDAELNSLHEELHVTRSELESLQLHLRREVAQQGREVQELREREEELKASTRLHVDETSRLAALLRQEKEERRAVRHEADELRRQFELTAEELRAARGEMKLSKERSDLEVEELRRRLKAEKSIRKACEKWLRAELKSREEYDTLLSAIRETATRTQREASASPPARLSPAALIPALPVNSPDVREVEELLETLRTTTAARAASRSPRRQQQQHDRGAGDAYDREESRSPASLVGVEAVLAARQVEEDNKRLRAELAAARSLLHQRLGK